YTPGDYEFDLPADFLSLLQSRNYGDYANADGELPVCFIAANHTSGGNSGSPAFNAKGELIGLNFDRIWEGTMSDFYFTPERCRNIMVDIRYVLWVVDVYAGAERLIQEMHIVD
ncbi:MAG: S46 family peptidase, partial [Schleiferiaceae bacterium]|nr:S46 family peptidase [Schleiferiaceae bacterium]